MEIARQGRLKSTYFLKTMKKQLSFACVAGLVGLGFAFAGAPVQAQQSELDVLRQQIIEMQNKLTALEEAQKATAAKAATPAMVTSSKMPVTVSGLLQVQYNSTLNDDRPGGASTDSFRLRRGEMRFTAPTILPNLSGTIQLDFAKTNAFSSSARGNSTLGSTIGGERNAVLQEIQLSYGLIKKPNASLSAEIGQAKLPFGYEGDLVSSGALQTVERALYFGSALGPGGVVRLAGDQRDTGLQLTGKFNDFEFRVGGYNGLGERQNTLDRDPSTSVVGRVLYRPKSLDGLLLGASYARGSVGGLNLAATGAPLDLSDIERKLANAFAVYKKDKITAQAEYFDVKLDGEGPTGTSNFSRDARSYYGSFGYLFKPQFEGVLRYDEFDADKDSSNAKTKEATIGANYYLKGNNAKIQANIIKVDRPRATSGDSNDSVELRTNFQVAF